MLYNDQEVVWGNIGVMGKKGTACLDRDMVLGKFWTTVQRSYVVTQSFERIG